MKHRAHRSILLASTVIGLATVLLSSLAQAHGGSAEIAGFARGFAHPFGGIDHILAMFAVGVWAAQRGERGVWLIPATFVLVMAFGGLAAAFGIALPFVEQGIVLSVLVLAVLVAAAIRLPLLASVFIVGLFALFHGHAHGTEMPAAASGLVYGAGFVLATACLHAVGIATALIIRRVTSRHARAWS